MLNFKFSRPPSGPSKISVTVCRGLKEFLLVSVTPEIGLRLEHKDILQTEICFALYTPPTLVLPLERIFVTLSMVYRSHHIWAILGAYASYDNIRGHHYTWEN